MAEIDRSQVLRFKDRQTERVCADQIAADVIEMMAGKDASRDRGNADRSRYRGRLRLPGRMRSWRC